MSELINNQTNV